MQPNSTGCSYRVVSIGFYFSVRVVYSIIVGDTFYRYKIDTTSVTDTLFYHLANKSKFGFDVVKTIYFSFFIVVVYSGVKVPCPTEIFNSFYTLD